MAANTEIFQMLPHVVIGVGIIVSILIEIFSKKSEQILPWFSIVIYLFAGAYSIINVYDNQVLFGGMFAVGGIAAIFNFIFTIGASIMVLNAVDYIKKHGVYFGEFYILVQSSVLGMMLMAGARDLFMVFLGLELMSICFYVLAGLNRKKPSNNEAALKYFLLGAFATGFIVFGTALIYGTAKTTSIDQIIFAFEYLATDILFIVGFTLFLIGFLFKIAAFPFHMWVPDVYQGAATPITGLMSTTGKAAAFSVLIVILSAIFTQNITNNFETLFAVVATLSMLYGSIVAIAQDNLKRMLAYSSISHAGYMAIGLAAGNLDSVAGIVFYLTAYAFMNLGAFGVIAMVEGENDSQTSIDSYAGLSGKSPILAGFMALFMFALAGIPPMAGFFGKYYVFIAAIKADLVWLAIVGVVSSVISVYFYLRVVVYMFFKDSSTEFLVRSNFTGTLAVVISGLLVLVFGILPDTPLNIIATVLSY
ncbi:MAG: NADH-quinone oxidoreductase subunit N [Melioribacteraceae bacterium]|nr:NADH-quinone oxidoreductase subunit N [Melioribacteraceae bacterium]